MKTLAFKSKVENNKIFIPDEMFAEIKDMNHKDVRVILLMEETDEFNEEAFKEFAKIFFTRYATNLESFKKLIEKSKE
jgi:chemotaxis protein CheY-P-specific phosphatase CheC